MNENLLESIPSQASNTSPTHILLGGFSILSTTNETLRQRLASTLQCGEQQTLFFANTNFIVKCHALRHEMQVDNTLIVNDGIGVDIANWIVHRKKFPENLNGTDFIPHYLHSVRQIARVYLLGGKPGIGVRAADTLTKDYGVTVVGTCNGYDQAQDSQKIIAAMNDAKANIILVALGNPAQEQWILEHRHALNACVLIGVGALLDFLAGDKPRAPRIIQRCRMEWLYRLCLEPQRLVRRYTLDIFIFLRLCLSTDKLLRTEKLISTDTLISTEKTPRNAAEPD